MTGQTQNWTIPVDALGVFQAQEKRLGMEERRPRITQASDIMGPGLAAFAVPVDDMSNETTAFNGFWYVPVGAANSPDDTLAWMGYTIATATEGGIQVLSTFEGVDAPHTQMMRGFEFAPSGGTRFYSTWQTVGGGGGGGSVVIDRGVETMDPTVTGTTITTAVNFAETFTVAPTVMCSVLQTNNLHVQALAGDVTTSGFTLAFTNFTNAAQRDCTWIAVGA